MSDLTRKQCEMLRILQSEGSYRFRITSMELIDHEI